MCYYQYMLLSVFVIINVLLLTCVIISISYYKYVLLSMCCYQYLLLLVYVMICICYYQYLLLSMCYLHFLICYCQHLLSSICVFFCICYHQCVIINMYYNHYLFNQYVLLSICIIMNIHNMKSTWIYLEILSVRNIDDGTNFFDTDTGVSQGDTLELFLFITCQNYNKCQWI